MFSRTVPLKMNGSWETTPIRARKRRQLEVSQIDPVDQDLASGGVVETHQQLEQGRLARAALADDRHDLAGRDPQVHVLRAPGHGSRT